MPSKPDTSFAYRASQFALNNKRFIYCQCATPYIDCSPPRGKYGNIQYCYICKGLVTEEAADNARELLRRQHGISNLENNKP